MSAPRTPFMLEPPRALDTEPCCIRCGHPVVWKPRPAVIPHADRADDADHPVKLAWREVTS